MTPDGRRVRIDLAYDGTEFDGWQVQPSRRTVQGVVEAALARIQGVPEARVRGAGRTDAGVHARRQVADAWVVTRLDDAGLLAALTAVLPDDVRPVALSSVPGAFHARRDALRKTYHYVLDLSRPGDPYRRRFALHHPQTLDREALDDAIGRLPGRRDFVGFAGSAGEVRTTVRDLTEASYRELPGETGAFSFTADGFLNHMVRNMVGTLLDVARGRFAPERVDDVLRTGNRGLAGPTSPARGLHLHHVVYPGESEPSGNGWFDTLPLV